MGLTSRKISNVSSSLTPFTFVGTFTSSYCRRYYPSNYKISGIYRNSYSMFDASSQQWVPYAINNFIVSNSGGCLPDVQLSWAGFGTPEEIRLSYVTDVWSSLQVSSQNGGPIPKNSWIIYAASSYVYMPMAFAKGSKWSPPRNGYSFVSGYSGYVTVK